MQTRNQNHNQSFIMSFIWNAQSILGTATIFADLGTAARAASVVYDGPALGRTEAGTHLGTSVTFASQTYPRPAIRPAKSCSTPNPTAVWRPSCGILRWGCVGTMRNGLGAVRAAVLRFGRGTAIRPREVACPRRGDARERSPAWTTCSWY